MGSAVDQTIRIMGYVVIPLLLVLLIRTSFRNGYVSILRLTGGIVSLAVFWYLFFQTNFIYGIANLLEGDWTAGSREPSQPTPVEPKEPSQPTPVEPNVNPSNDPINIDWGTILSVGGVVLAIALVLLLLFGVIYAFIRHRETSAPAREAARLKIAQMVNRREENKTIWRKILSEGDSLVEKWAALSGDVSTIIKNPVYGRLDNPLTRAVIEAVSTVRNERRELPLDLDSDPWETSYAQAVKQLRNDLRVLESSAKFYYLSNFSDRELKLLSQAESLLSVARNEASAPNERQMAYTRLKAVLKDLHLDLAPETESQFEIEQRAVKMITATN